MKSYTKLVFKKLNSCHLNLSLRSASISSNVFCRVEGARDRYVEWIDTMDAAHAFNEVGLFGN